MQVTRLAAPANLVPSYVYLPLLPLSNFQDFSPSISLSSSQVSSKLVASLQARERKKRTITTLQTSLNIQNTKLRPRNKRLTQQQQLNFQDAAPNKPEMQLPLNSTTDSKSTSFLANNIGEQRVILSISSHQQHKNKKPVHAIISQETVNRLFKLLLLFALSVFGSVGLIFVISALTVVEALQVRGNCFLVSACLAHLLVTTLVLPSSGLQLMAGESAIEETALCHNQWLALEFCLIVTQLSFMFIAVNNFLGFRPSQTFVLDKKKINNNNNNTTKMEQSLLGPNLNCVEHGERTFTNCCGKGRVIAWIACAWLLAGIYVALQHKQSYGSTFCRSTTTPTPTLQLSNAINATTHSQTLGALKKQLPLATDSLSRRRRTRKAQQQHGQSELFDRLTLVELEKTNNPSDYNQRAQTGETNETKLLLYNKRQRQLSLNSNRSKCKTSNLPSDHGNGANCLPSFHSTSGQTKLATSSTLAPVSTFTSTSAYGSNFANSTQLAILSNSNDIVSDDSYQRNDGVDCDGIKVGTPGATARVAQSNCLNKRQKTKIKRTIVELKQQQHQTATNGRQTLVWTIFCCATIASSCLSGVFFTLSLIKMIKFKRRQTAQAAQESLSSALASLSPFPCTTQVCLGATPCPFPLNGANDEQKNQCFGFMATSGLPTITTAASFLKPQAPQTVTTTNSQPMISLTQNLVGRRHALEQTTSAPAGHSLFNSHDSPLAQAKAQTQAFAPGLVSPSALTSAPPSASNSMSATVSESARVDWPLRSPASLRSRPPASEIDTMNAGRRRRRRHARSLYLPTASCSEAASKRSSRRSSPLELSSTAGGNSIVYPSGDKAVAQNLIDRQANDEQKLLQNTASNELSSVSLQATFVEELRIAHSISNSNRAPLSPISLPSFVLRSQTAHLKLQQHKQRTASAGVCATDVASSSLETGRSTYKSNRRANSKEVNDNKIVCDQANRKVLLCAYAYITNEQLLWANAAVFVYNTSLWLPLVCLALVSNFGNNFKLDSMQTARDAVWWAATLNCCTSCYIYALANRDFRSAFEKLFYYCCFKSHVTFARRAPVIRRQVDVDKSGNLRVHIIPALNLNSNVNIASAVLSNFATSGKNLSHLDAAETLVGKSASLIAQLLPDINMQAVNFQSEPNAISSKTTTTKLAQPV